MILNRPFWQKRIENAWEQKNVIWLMGVRNVGKASLCQSLNNIEYFDCELPRVRQLLEDPESFLESQENKRIILDEIHRLDNPSEILKIAADHYKKVKIIATGSSTLGASAKFKDTLTGRKKEIWLTPLLLEEMEIFGSQDLRHRFLFGGFPSYFEKKQLPEVEYREWIDAYWAKDIHDMFSVGKRDSFIKFTELLLATSGGQFEAIKFAAACEVSRPTIANYLAVLKETFVVHVIRPFSTHRATEIVMAPKVYGFDTGFVCYAKGRTELRQEDVGLMWEQCVLNELHGHLQIRTINYWRDKQGHELDFVVHERGLESITVIECKFSTIADSLGQSMVTAIGTNVAAFRHHYPQGENFVVASNVDTPFTRQYKDITLKFVNVHHVVDVLKKKRL